ncbi:MAG: DUF2153 family protein [Thermoproteota archaeon]|jgi:hypothetical protein|nr:DUF2153 family protein [Thermoproteota archaeon]
MAFNETFVRSMQDWVNEQKKILEIAVKSFESKNYKEADRLNLLLASRTACQHISRTIKGFENWLQNPAIISVMPKEMLEEIYVKIWKLMIELIEFDIKHTSDFLNHVKDKQKLDISSLLIREERTDRSPIYSL